MNSIDAPVALRGSTQPGEGASTRGEAVEYIPDYREKLNTEERLVPSLVEAESFLTLLDSNTKTFCFQTFDDDKARKRPDLARILEGTLAQHWDTLCDLNRQGAGIFITVNRTDGRGRKKANITSIRAVWQEDDGEGKPLPVTPHITVGTSPGKRHRYLLTDTDQVEEFEGVQKRQVEDYGSDPNAADRSRVLRLPGFFHMKDRSRPHLVAITELSMSPPMPWEEVMVHFPPVARKTQPVKEVSAGPAPNMNIEKIESALNALPPDVYSDWLQVGLALHDASGGSAEGFELWDDWSSNGSTYTLGECRKKWAGFSAGNGITIGTLFKMATDTGWRWHTSPEEDFANLAGRK